MTDFKGYNKLDFLPQTGAYKVILNSLSIWRDFSEARLQISVCNPKHTGDKFFALTEWAAARFDKVTLIVSDTLQRHNLAIQHNISLEEAGRSALFEGHKWLRDNDTAIKNFSPSQCIIARWDDWRTHPEYLPTRAEIDGLYHENPLVRAAINQKVEEFCLRQILKGTLEGLNNQAVINSSVEFILEELAAFGIMLRQQPVLDIYPGPWFKEIFSVIATEAGESPLLTGFDQANFLNVDYKRNKGFVQGASPKAALLKTSHNLG